MKNIIRLPEVKNRTGLSRSMIYLMMKENRFPQAIRVGGTRCTGWVDSEVDGWVADKIEAGRKARKVAEMPSRLEKNGAEEKALSPFEVVAMRLAANGEYEFAFKIIMMSREG